MVAAVAVVAAVVDPTTNLRVSQPDDPKSRKLQAVPEIDYVGNNGNFEVNPLRVCMGDCDVDDDCAGDLVCYQRGANEAVPGCEGGEDDGSDSDYCILIPSEAPTSVPTVAPKGVPSQPPSGIPKLEIVFYEGSNGGELNNGLLGSYFANATGNATVPFELSSNTTLLPLGLCQGVCRDDSDCSRGLVCFERNPGGAVPYCQEDDSSQLAVSRNFLSSLQFCTFPPTPQPSSEPTQEPTPFPTPKPTPEPTLRPTPQPTITPRPTLRPTPRPTPRPTGWPFPDSSAAPDLPNAIFVGNPTPRILNECEADCDRDSDCGNGLYCLFRDEGDAVPGCNVVGPSPIGNRLALSDVWDVCVKSRAGPQGNQIRFKLYWQRGYFWQEVDYELFYCMEHSLREDECRYGEDERDCDYDHIYIMRCSRSQNQVFELIYQPDGRALIKAVTRGLCLDGGRPNLRTCDSSKETQLWHPQNGGWGSSNGFELTRIGREDRCLTQHHHPRDTEIVEFGDCERNRRDTTSKWEFYW